MSSIDSLIHANSITGEVDNEDEVLVDSDDEEEASDLAKNTGKSKSLTRDRQEVNNKSSPIGTNAQAQAQIDCCSKQEEPWQGRAL